MTDDELKIKAQLMVYWGEYSCLQETLRRLEKRASKAWGGQVTTPIMASASAMKQLRMELEALEVGFDETAAV